MRQIVLLIALAVTLSSCEFLGLSRDCGEFCPWPNPPLLSPVPADMAEAVTVATPVATEYSQTPVELRTAFALELKDWCNGEDAMCPGMTGPGWGVVFDITGPDGQPGAILVVLDSQPKWLFTEQ
jgi:hypothetical protein